MYFGSLIQSYDTAFIHDIIILYNLYMHRPFKITYRFHWCGPCPPDEDTKQETCIDSEGNILVRTYDHHGCSVHYRIIGRAVTSVSSEEAEKLYQKLWNIVQNNTGNDALTDAAAEVILEEPGIRLSADAGLSYDHSALYTILDDFMKGRELHRQAMKKKK